MELIKELFSSSLGIMSALMILFMIGMGVFFTVLFVKKAYEAQEPQSEQPQNRQ
ncbi:hypothetical protein GCM10009123_06500 [Kangiella japonica]|uniref:DUF3149 domain-containing protein n=1 Tax=Kangiella japonica TaxID=647384 RepID=A0ABN0SV62_9GAMM